MGASVWLSVGGSERSTGAVDRSVGRLISLSLDFAFLFLFAFCFLLSSFFNSFTFQLIWLFNSNFLPFLVDDRHTLRVLQYVVHETFEWKKQTNCLRVSSVRERGAPKSTTAHPPLHSSSSGTKPTLELARSFKTKQEKTRNEKRKWKRKTKEILTRWRDDEMMTTVVYLKNGMVDHQFPNRMQTERRWTN